MCQLRAYLQSTLRRVRMCLPKFAAMFVCECSVCRSSQGKGGPPNQEPARWPPFLVPVGSYSAG